MSSIISDIFYGSKQNLLDNYLINRNQYHHQSSVPQDAKNAIYTSFIELTIKIPRVNTEKSIYYQITAQMGSKIDENIIQLSSSNDIDTPHAVLMISDLEKQDLNKYTNIKITISEGKYKNKVFGFIPIQSVKALANYSPAQKTIILQMKGKKFIGFSTVQCIIRTDFPNNNILNSQIMKSIQKDNSSISNNKLKYKQNDISQISHTSEHLQWVISQKQQKRYIPKKRYNPQQSARKVSHYERKSSEDIYFKQNQKRQNKPIISYKKQQAYVQFVRQVKQISMKFSQINVGKQLLQQSVRIKYKQKQFNLNEVISFDKITKQGIQLQIHLHKQILGKINLSILFLTMTDTTGQLPIYNEAQKCIGTILVSPFHPGNAKKDNFNYDKKHQDIHQADFVQDNQQVSEKKVIKHLLILNIQKIIMSNITSELNSESLDAIMLQKYDQFDFSKMQAYNRIELVVRVNGLNYKFDNIVIRYIVDKQNVKIVQFRRREGFFIRHFQTISQQANKVQIQLYSNYRLLTYSKIMLDRKSTASHYFVGGSTDFTYCQCGIYIKAIKLQTQQQYFRQHKIQNVFQVLQSLLTIQIKLKDTSDQSIKIIMNNHKKATYIQTKKLMRLLEPILSQFRHFQQANLLNAMSIQQPQKTEILIKLNTAMLRQFIEIDIKGLSIIQKPQFQKLIHFFGKQQFQGQDSQFYNLIAHPVTTNDGKILYPFFVAGLYFVQEKQLINQSELINPLQTVKQTQNKISQRKNILSEGFKQISLQVQPMYFIQKITLTNIHILNNGKVPNVCLSMAKKIHYSNSNPEFIIEKQVNLMQPIKIFNKNIATSSLTLLAQFQLSRRQTHYQLDPSGKSMVKIVWGL